MATSVFCLANDQPHAVEIVNRLKAAGFTSNDISVLLPDRSGTRDFAHEHHTKAPEGAVAGAGAGGILGGTLGWFTGIGVLAIPGLGPFIAAGPIMAALSGAAIGAAAGGLTGGLIGMGLPEFEAKRYEGKLREGGTLLSVHCMDGTEVDQAREIFKNCKARDISSAGEKAVPDADESNLNSSENPPERAPLIETPTPAHGATRPIGRTFRTVL